MSTRAADLVLETLVLEQDGRVLTAEICDPPHNYMTGRMQRDLDALTAAVDDDPGVGAVVLTGGVSGRYITHFDISHLLAAAEGGRYVAPGTVLRLLDGIDLVPGARHVAERTPIGGLVDVARFNDVVLRIMRSPAVYIAAIGGPCGGGGLELSVCFDVRLAADDHLTGFMLPELLIGLTTTVGGQRLAQLIGPGRALEFMLEGRRYSPREAEAMGLVNRVVPAGKLRAEASAMAARYARRNRGTVAAQKRIFNENLGLRPAESLRHEGALSASAMSADAAATALRKWVDMQAPDGDSVFLTEPGPWTTGEAVRLND